MKKFALALLCIVSVAFFASCSKDEDKAGNPTINFVQDEGYISSGDTIEALTPYMFGIQAKSNETTKELLTKCFIQVLRGEERVYDTLVDNINQNQYNFDGQIALPEGDYTIIATVHNDKDMTAECRMTITSVVTDTPLEVKDFTWNRHGGDDATGLAEYGLEWTSNLKDVFAQIKPMDGYTLYELNSEDWTNTQTINEKTLLLTNVATEGQSIPVFNKISAFTPASNLDYVLATINFTTYDAHILHITSSEVTTFKGTDVKIFGQAK